MLRKILPDHRMVQAGLLPVTMGSHIPQHADKNLLQKARERQGARPVGLHAKDYCL